MTNIRAFFAIDLPDSQKQQIETVIKLLRAYISNPQIRWTQPNNLHITLQFLAQIKESDLPVLTQQVQKTIQLIRPFDLLFDQLEWFPSHHHPRIISFAFSPSDALTQLVKTIGEGILATGYSIETRPFRGHLTLARVPLLKKNISLPDTKTKIKKIHVDTVTLYQSTPNKMGSNYIPLQHFRLTAC